MCNFKNPLCLALAILVIAGCAGTSSKPIEPRIDINENSFIPQSATSYSPLPISTGIGESNLLKWEAFTSRPSADIDDSLNLYTCGVYDWLPQIPPSSWFLTGAQATPVYKPILDIEAMRTGTPSRNETIYYHFRLKNSED